MPKDPGSPARVRILVADDDPILREFAITHLSTAEIEVLVAANGAQALSLLHQHACDIALVDLDMPVMNGFELIGAIRADIGLQHLPVVVITGREDMVAIDEAFSSGATSFVVKPLNWQLLGHQVAYVLRNAQTEQHLRTTRDLLHASDARKNDVLRLMRHEFYTPLNAITGFSKLITETSADPDTRDRASEVLAAAARLKQLSDDLFAASAAVSGDIQPVASRFAPGDVLDSASQAALQDTGADPSRLRILDRTGGVPVSTGFQSLKLALRNLLRNALTHGRPETDGPPVLLVANLEVRSGSLLLAVLDDGPGMPQAMIDASRQAFTQAETALTRTTGGLGLGIAITQAHVTALGGQLDFAPRGSAGGLIATIILPGIMEDAGQDHTTLPTLSAA